MRPIKDKIFNEPWVEVERLLENQLTYSLAYYRWTYQMCHEVNIIENQIRERLYEIY